MATQQEKMDISTHPHFNPGPFNESDLIMDGSGQIYHLAVKHEDIARDIILVGDPERVPQIVDQYFSKVEFDMSHRGLRTMTGEVKESGQRVTVATTGMGSSLEVVVNELMLLNEIDPDTRIRRNMVDPLNIVRVGTCGVLQDDTNLGTSIISSYAIGLDNSGLFYSITRPAESCIKIENKVKEMLDRVMDPADHFYGRIWPYASKADELLVEAMVTAAQELGAQYDLGATVASSGFFANQGRDVGRSQPSVPDIDRHLARLDLEISGGQRILNMEMESAYLFHFGAAHGYRCGTVCAGVANREHNKFQKNRQEYAEAVHNASSIALRALAKMRAG